MMSKRSWRYIEMSYKQPEDDQIRFMATVVETDTPNQAVERGREVVLEQHPGALEIEEFMQRVVTPERATRIEDQMRNGTWEGWLDWPSERARNV